MCLAWLVVANYATAKSRGGVKHIRSQVTIASELRAVHRGAVELRAVHRCAHARLLEVLSDFDDVNPVDIILRIYY